MTRKPTPKVDDSFKEAKDFPPSAFVVGIVEAREIERDNERLQELAKAYEEYVDLLAKELNETVMMATVHGWRSTRYSLGVALRERIENLKQ